MTIRADFHLADKRVIYGDSADRLSGAHDGARNEFHETDTGRVYEHDGVSWSKTGSNGSVNVDASPNIVLVTPDDASTYIPPLLGIRVGTTAGAVKVTSGGVDVTIPTVAVGETITGSITKVFATGTSAAGITGWQR